MSLDIVRWCWVWWLVDRPVARLGLDTFNVPQESIPGFTLTGYVWRNILPGCDLVEDPGIARGRTKDSGCDACNGLFPIYHQRTQEQELPNVSRVNLCFQVLQRILLWL